MSRPNENEIDISQCDESVEWLYLHEKACQNKLDSSIWPADLIRQLDSMYSELKQDFIPLLTARKAHHVFRGLSFCALKACEIDNLPSDNCIEWFVRSSSIFIKYINEPLLLSLCAMALRTAAILYAKHHQFLDSVVPEEVCEVLSTIDEKKILSTSSSLQITAAIAMNSFALSHNDEVCALARICLHQALDEQDKIEFHTRESVEAQAKIRAYMKRALKHIEKSIPGLLSRANPCHCKCRLTGTVQIFALALGSTVAILSPVLQAWWSGGSAYYQMVSIVIAFHIALFAAFVLFLPKSASSLEHNVIQLLKEQWYSQLRTSEPAHVRYLAKRAELELTTCGAQSSVISTENDQNADACSEDWSLPDDVSLAFYDSTIEVEELCPVSSQSTSAHGVSVASTSFTVDDTNTSSQTCEPTDSNQCLPVARRLDDIMDPSAIADFIRDPRHGTNTSILADRTINQPMAAHALSTLQELRERLEESNDCTYIEQVEDDIEFLSHLRELPQS